MVGSLTGRLEGTVTNSYATGSVTITEDSGKKNNYNVLVGSRRGQGGTITQSADLTDNDQGYPFIINEPEGKNSVISRLTIEQLSQESTYMKYGWDFTTAWKLSGSGYKLPILRGSFEKEQQSLVMPAHLNKSR
jgi:hypothetical protein